ncbi:hypothetical protein PGT21_037064 [Puccinia graminis f. sp. tritici]|uniref:Uncharacterized protein n=1 Tax=Puccinia graminis f. sp. tritici TaxID=56615 RepID=A0A5B0QQP0_PUCGR|nr:hypothetical protein PGT21_037064 [Puccinia graminis f. sp. tritici]
MTCQSAGGGQVFTECVVHLTIRSARGGSRRSPVCQIIRKIDQLLILADSPNSGLVVDVLDDHLEARESHALLRSRSRRELLDRSHTPA